MSLTKENLVWEVTGIKTKNETNGDGVVLPNAVCQTYWKASYTDADGNEGSFSGATPFSAVNLSADEFAQFDTLTEELVLGWVKNIVVDSYEDHVLSMIQRQIDELAISEADMPWAPIEPEVDMPSTPTEES